MSRRVLFIEDLSSSLREECGAVLNFVSECASWDSPLPERLRKQPLDLVVAVAVPDRPSVHDFFHWLAKTPIGVPTLAVLSGDDDLMRAAVKAVDDFIVVPFRPIELQHRVTRLLGGEADDAAKAAAHERLTRELALAGLVGKHPAFLHTIEQIPVVARCHTPILITGETGTGKELCARAIHHLSTRRHLPFIPVDCAALPEHLFESEMFGHARGAFTDAHRDQKGLVALAGDGTLFLDEVDSLSITAQSKLLRLLQEHTYRPVGSERFVPTGVRIMAACNQDLERLVQERKFRSDLFFRLNVLRLHLPPLRERRSDVAVLARHILETLAVEHGTPRKNIAPALLQMLTAYDWPGNVRELYNVLQRAVVFCSGTQVQLADIADLSAAAESPKPPGGNFHDERARAVAAFERSYIEEMLRRAAGNVTQAARLAGKDRRVFGRLMKRHNIRRDPV
jgi:two-component system, NtrC family, response regulator GlrR